MPELKRPIHVFLCHASQDKPAVRELYQRLNKEDWVDPWLDEEKLTLGQHWTSAIEDALDAADVVIIFLSHNSVQKEGFVQRELNYAWDISLEKPRNVIFLIPFRLDDCEVPRHLRSRQWGDYFGEEKDRTYQTLLRSLKERHEQKLKLEEAELARKEQQERESEAAEKAAQEKAAREHRSQANKHLVDGFIPDTALPQEAAILFEKAKSALKVGHYNVALELILQTKEILKQNGFTKWMEGQDYEVQLQANIEAEDVAQEGANFFNQGKFDEAIDRVEKAYQITQLPEYKILSEKYHQFKIDYKDISNTIMMERENPDAVSRVLKKLDDLSLEYAEHPSLQTLRIRLQLIIPSITEILVQKIKGLKVDIERNTTIEGARIAAQQAKLRIDQAIKLGITDVALARLSRDVNNLISKLSELEDSLVQAEHAYIKQRKWPAEAWTISAEVRERFPGDPKVLKLQSKLSSYGKNQIILKVTVILIIFVVLLVVLRLVFSKFTTYMLSLTPTATFTLTAQPVSPSQTSQPIRKSETSTITITPTGIVTTIATPLPTEIADAKGISMVLVPAGEFTMGSNDGASYEKPAHTIYLDAFYIDTYEVSNALYDSCVNAGVCKVLSPKAAPALPFVDLTVGLNYPVVNINWSQAKIYCEWRGGQLPTEAQWEKAARGVNGFLYPWGNEYDFTGCEKGNYGHCSGGLFEISSFEDGISPYGVFNMYGNASEWVADWFDEKYYQNMPLINPPGPSSGNSRVIKGGSSSTAHEPSFTLSNRQWRNPNLSYDDLGFRCGKAATP